MISDRHYTIDTLHLLLSMASANRSSTNSGSPADVFDYIVVGGGTSGLVVASRLTEDAQVKVLVLEAGADRRSDPRTFVPGLAVQTYDDPDFDWSYLTVPQVRLPLVSLLQKAVLTLL